jgi:hypothetical protein
MAVCEHSAILMRLMDLSIFIDQMVSHFPRYYRYCLGGEFRARCHQI